jgi:hypothetical protein
MARKILYSPGYGAGWSTWMSGVPSKFACEYKPLIEAVERGEKLHQNHPLVLQFIADAKREFGIADDGYVCVLGAGSLAVEEVPDDALVRIDEYDGFESVETQAAAASSYF